jgi:phosphate-selective porin OprO/OprP
MKATLSARRMFACAAWCCTIAAGSVIHAQYYEAVNYPTVPTPPAYGQQQPQNQDQFAADSYDGQGVYANEAPEAVSYQDQEMLDEARIRELIEEYVKEHPAEAPAAKPGTLHATWRNGLEIESEDKEFRVHVGGRVQLDGTWYDGDNAVQFGPNGLGELNDAVNFRRARFRIDGTMYYTIDWAAEFDWSNTVNDDPTLPVQPGAVVIVPCPTDLWLTFTHLPCIGNVRIGNHKEPMGMEHLTSSRFLDFMERSFLQEVFWGPFNNGFSPGISAFNWNEAETFTWHVGAYKNTTNIFGWGVGDGEYAATGRLTWCPWYCNDGRSVLHFGVSASHRDPDNDTIRFRTRASLRSGPPGPLNPVIADTGTFFADSQDIAGAEIAGVLGPFNFQGEYACSTVEDATVGLVNNGTYMAHGWYMQGLYFLTGENRVYNRRAGVFDRVKPFENFFMVDTCDGCIGHGCGAWQLGVRYSFLDLRDSGIDGGIVEDWTFGVNWFLNPNAKMQFNYVWCDRDAPVSGVNGEFQGFGVRLAYDF